MNNKIFKKSIKTIVIILLLVNILIIFKHKERIINNIPFRYVVIKSNSMYPIFKKNDIIIIQRKKSYKVGDIITYNYKNQYFITHRIIEITENGVITKGDNNNCVDNEVVSAENIIGKIILIIDVKVEIIFLCILIVFILIKFFKKGKRI